MGHWHQRGEFGYILLDTYTHAATLEYLRKEHPVPSVWSLRCITSMSSPGTVQFNITYLLQDALVAFDSSGEDKCH